MSKLSQKEKFKLARLSQAFPNVFHESKNNTNLMLIVVLGPLYLTKSHKLQYTYYERPVVRNKITMLQSKLKLVEVVADLRSILSLGKQFSNIFTKDGSKIYSIIDFLQNDNLYILTSMNSFKGLEHAENINQPTPAKLVSDVIYRSSCRSTDCSRLFTQ